MDDKYGTGQKGLYTSGGTNRFKFQDKQARAKNVDVDVAHKVRAEGFLDADKAQDPDVEGGSFFQQELDRSKELNVTPPFKLFYYKVSCVFWTSRTAVAAAVSVVRAQNLRTKQGARELVSRGTMILCACDGTRVPSEIPLERTNMSKRFCTPAWV